MRNDREPPRPQKSKLTRLAERAEFEGGAAKRAQIRPATTASPGIRPWYLVIKRWDGELSVVTRPQLAEHGDEERSGGTMPGATNPSRRGAEPTARATS
jgi:hypothetical protein